jgi:hypothetical protein
MRCSPRRSLRTRFSSFEILDDIEMLTVDPAGKHQKQHLKGKSQHWAYATGSRANRQDCCGTVPLFGQYAVARSINAAMTATYWEIGRRIVEFEQGGADRAAYGDVLVERLAKDLTQRFGRGFSRQNLGQMRAAPLT